MVFGQNLKILILAKQDINRKRSRHLKRSRMVQILAPWHLPVRTYGYRNLKCMHMVKVVTNTSLQNFQLHNQTKFLAIYLLV